MHLAVLDYNRLRKELLQAGFNNVNEQDYDYVLHRKDFMMKLRAYK